jgi:hypothetical protein
LVFPFRRLTQKEGDILMAMELKTTGVNGFVKPAELTNMETLLNAVNDELLTGKGAGSDFLGWLDLPVNYDKEEFARIQKAAKKIQSDSDVLVVIGIGGSYLGAKAVLEAMSDSFKFLHKKRTEPVVVFAGQNISEDYTHELLEAVKEYEAERKYGYSWNVIDIALYKISYFAQPQGQLMNDLDKAVDDMDKELPVAELVTKGKAFLERLLAMPREELARDLYFVDTLVSAKRRSSLNNVQENFKEVYKEAADAIEAENYERSAVRILYKFYEMYFYNDVQDDLNAVIANALRKSAGKSMEEASEILFEALEKVMDDDLTTDDDEETGELGAAAAAAVEQVQQMAAAMQGEIVQMQAAMQQALMKGDMAEYMRLAQEFQQKMMEQALGQQK